MQELAGRLTALDPEASASLKVISYFDTLVASGAGLDAIVRAAAMLSGAPAGAETSGRTIRVDAAGRRADGIRDGGWPSSTAGGRAVWIEREGSPHANDAMVLDRLSLAVAIVDARGPGSERSAVEIALDAESAPEERAVAVARLTLSPGPLHVIAQPVDSGERMPGHSAVIAGAHGLVRATIAATDAVGVEGPAGVASAASPDRLPAAWTDARIALRLADHRRPVVRADDLGAMIALARDFDPAQPRHPDIDVLLDLDERTRELLDELVAADSVRSAATALGLHHSSLQARHESLTRQLGYDPRSPLGRPRYEAARLLSRLV
jgi:hypothetical protein